MRRSFQPISRSSAFGSTFERSTMFSCRRRSWPIDLMVVSSGPKRVVNAICCASVSRWPGKISTEYSWNASWIFRNVASSTAAVRSTPSTRAPSTGWTGVICSGAMRARVSRERRAAPALAHRELAHRLALELRELFDRTAEGHHGRHGHVRGQAEQLFELRLLGDGEGGDGAGEAARARREQDVPGKRVDRRATDDADAVEVLVGGGDDLEVDADHQHDGRLQHRLDEPHQRLGGLDGRGGHARRGDGSLLFGRAAHGGRWYHRARFRHRRHHRSASSRRSLTPATGGSSAWTTHRTAPRVTTRTTGAAIS